MHTPSFNFHKKYDFANYDLKFADFLGIEQWRQPIENRL